MTYEEFKKKHNGKKCDYDKACGYQCWDLGMYYITECLNLPASILAGCGLVSNMLKEPKLSQMLKYFDEVKKSDIKKGDIVIWTYGHIAIFDSKKKGINYYFSQNPNAPKVITINNEGYRVFRKKTTKKEDTKKESKSSSTNSELLNLVRRTIRGDFGNGKNRKQILGSNYDKVQYQVEQNIKHKTTVWDKIKLY